MSWHATKKASKLPALDKDKILVFDTETTGLNPPTDKILQITILNGYGTVLFDSLIRPKHRKKWSSAEKINHISYDMVKDMPTFSSVRKEIQELFNKAQLVVGYNVNFDIKFIEAEGIVVPGKIFDVMTAFASYRCSVDKTFYRRCKLKECAEYFGHTYTPHKSSEDAFVTLECFNSLLNDPRFTTYTPKRKAPEKKQVESTPTPKTSFTVQRPTGHRHNLIVSGLLLLVLSEVLLFITENILICNISDYFNLINEISGLWATNRLECILIVVLGVGLLFLILGLIRLIVRFPRTLSAKAKHFFYNFIYRFKKS